MAKAVPNKPEDGRGPEKDEGGRADPAALPVPVPANDAAPPVTKPETKPETGTDPKKNEAPPTAEPAANDAAPPVPPVPPVPAPDATPPAAEAKELPPATPPAPEKEHQSPAEKWLRRIGLGDFVEAAKAQERKASRLSEAFFKLIGFGDIFKAAKRPKGKTRGVLKAVFNKAADMAAGRMMSMSFRLIAITFVAGMIGGVSTWGTMALLALATGASSAVYTYTKEYLGAKLRGPKEQRALAKFIDGDRARTAGVAFLTGTLSGAFGAWLAKLPVFQSFMDSLRGGVDTVTKPVTDVIQPKAAPLVEGITGAFTGAATRPAAPLPLLAPRRPVPAFGM